MPEPADNADLKGPIVVERHDRGVSIGRIALIVAAVVALFAVGTAIYRNRAVPPPPPTAAGGDINQRIAELEAATKASPADAEGWRKLGWAYYGTERFALSADAYRRATALDPKNVDSWSALGEALALASTKHEISPESEAAFRKALTIDPADPRARYFLAVKKDLAGDHQGAIDDWIALLKETPPGAPWEQSVRDTITQVATANKIDVAGKLPASRTPPPAASAATDGIPGPTREQMAAASSLPPGAQDEMVKAMVESLAGKMKANPKDSDGWLRLIRARMVLGQQDAARQDLASALAAFAGDKAGQAKIGDGARVLGVPGA